jgi:hypothetical protein
VPLAPARGPWVAVLNGTTSAGLARRVAGVVAGLGYRSLPSGNAAVADVPRTTLYATAGNVTAARALAATLGVRIAVARMTREVAAVSPRAGITVVLGRTPAPPDEVSSLRLTGPFGAAGVASFVRRDNGTVALSLRTSRVARGSYLVGWVPGAGGWTRMGNVPLPRTSGWPTVIEPVGRTLPEGFLLTEETAGAQPARPGRTVLTSRR